METVTFYSWIENTPSSLTVRISGGHRQKDSTTGAILALEHKEIHFNMGIFHTDDAETIRELRKLIKKGDTITEDHEVYLRHVMKPEDQAKRAIKQNSELLRQNESLRTEIAKLNARIGKNSAKVNKAIGGKPDENENKEAAA